jgi:hypothetical protein
LIVVLPPWDQPTLQRRCYVSTQERIWVSVYVTYTKKCANGAQNLFWPRLYILLY